MNNYTKTRKENHSGIFYYNDKNQLHRLDGPAAEWASGSKEWWVDGNKHRLDGPAVEDANGYKFWYVDGKRHRLDGPAIEYADGYKAWYVDGDLLTEEEFNKHPLVIEKIVDKLICEIL